jgi:hypothetical protein
MIESQTQVILEKLDGLRTELADLAFQLECRGRVDAADVAIMTSARLGELCEEFTAAGLSRRPSAPCLRG